MPRLKVRFDEPEHGWVCFVMEEGGEPLLSCVASYIYASFSQLVTAISMMLDAREDRVVVWMEEPAELEMRFSRRGEDDVVQLELTSFDGYERPREKPEPEFSFVGTYDEICLPFWRALRGLEGRYSPEELARRWGGYFPHRELALLTERLGKA